MLMPNMVKRRSANGHTKANKSTIKLSNEKNSDNKPNEPVDHDHDDHPTQTPHSSTMDMFNSIELLTDIEELLRKLSRQLVIDTVNAENRDEIEKKKTNIVSSTSFKNSILFIYTTNFEHYVFVSIFFHRNVSTVKICLMIYDNSHLSNEGNVVHHCQN